MYIPNDKSFIFIQTKDTFTSPIAEQTLIPCFTFTQLHIHTRKLPCATAIFYCWPLSSSGEAVCCSRLWSRAYWPWLSMESRVFMWTFVLHQFIYNISSISVRPMWVKTNELMNSSIQCKENITKLIVTLLAECRSQTKSASLMCALLRKESWIHNNANWFQS